MLYMKVQGPQQHEIKTKSYPPTKTYHSERKNRHRPLAKSMKMKIAGDENNLKGEKQSREAGDLLSQVQS